jgi:hypothetical protein
MLLRVSLLVALLLSSVAVSARADDARPDEHGPHAPGDRFPSHVLQLAAHQPERVQLAFHYGLVQPLLLHGFNAAVDVRYRRLIVTYSHGQGLDATSMESAAEKTASMTLHEPWTTGGGVGVLLLDELWVLADVKVHRFEVATPLDQRAYTNVTVGGELGWRYFLWKGLNVGVVLRFWPNVYSSAGSGVVLHDGNGKTFVHEPARQGYGGLFGNVLVGWAFDL